MASTARTAFVVLGFGVLVASSSSILVRLAQEAGIPSIAIAAWRMVFAAAVVLPLALWLRRAEIATLGRRHGAVAAIAGVFLAGHFVAWITSLEYTSVASSAALVTTNPIWVGLATVFLLREPLPKLSIIGIAISLAGCALILWADADAGATVAAAGRSTATFGNLLALLGALGVSAYLLTGRTLARRLSLLGYVAVVYSVAAVVLVLVALLVGVPLTGYPAAGWLAVIGLALGPQLIGHTSFNWALRHLSPTFVALSILGEPVGSAILAAVLLREVPGPMQLAAFGVLLAGIAVAALGERAGKADVVQPVA